MEMMVRSLEKEDLIQVKHLLIVMTYVLGQIHSKALIHKTGKIN
jgi:hypothetical protein